MGNLFEPENVFQVITVEITSPRQHDCSSSFMPISAVKILLHLFIFYMVNLF